MLSTTDRGQTIVNLTALIVNVMKESKKDYLPLDTFQDVLNFIHEELAEMNKLQDYVMLFSLTDDIIERTVRLSRNILTLDDSKGTILLRNPSSIESLAEKYTLDGVLKNIIRKFFSRA